MIGVRPVRITTPAQAKFYLKVAAANPKPGIIEALIDYCMRTEPECPIAEYLSIVLTYIRYGKISGAKEMIGDVADFVCGEKAKYNDAEHKDSKPLGVVSHDKA